MKKIFLNSILFSALFFVNSHKIEGQTFTGGPIPIIDNATNSGIVAVSGISNTANTNFGLESICFTIEHTYNSDIQLILISPDGIEITLFSGIGGGDNGFTNTCLNGNTTNTLGNATFPYTGTFRPQGILGNLNAGNLLGNWTLRTIDNANGDEGQVVSWSLNFGSTPSPFFIFNQSNLPIIRINTPGNVTIGDNSVFSDMTIYYNQNGTRNFTNQNPYFVGKAALNVRGNYSASLPQKPYAVEIQDINGTAIDTSLFGMPRESDWILLANYNDKTFIRNTLTYEMSEDMGHYATRRKHVDVIVNGEYKGIYVFLEKIKRDVGRVDIAKLDVTENSGTNLTGGYITKIDYWEPSNSWQLAFSPPSFPTWDIHMVYYYPKPELITAQQKTYIQSIWNGFETALYSSDFTNPTTGYRSYIAEKSWADYFIIAEVTRNVDSYKKSRFFQKEKDNVNGSLGQIKAGPVWDFDWALKAYDSNDDMSGWSYELNQQDVNPPGYYTRLLQDPYFANLIKCRYSDFRRTILDTNVIFNYVDSMANFLNESQGWHYDTWGHLTASNTSPEFAPTSFSDAILKHKNFYRKRLLWLDANLPGTLAGCSFSGLQTIELPTYLRAFPNPASNEVHLQISAMESIQQLTVFDMKGVLVFNKQIEISSETTMLTLDTRSWNEGLYIVRVNGGIAGSELKIVIAR